MGDLLAISVLVAFVAVVFRGWWQERAEDRATRDSMRVFDAWRDALR